MEQKKQLTQDEIAEILYNQQTWYYKTRQQIYSVIKTIQLHRDYSMDDLIQEFFLIKCIPSNERSKRGSKAQFYSKNGIIQGLLNYALQLSKYSKQRKEVLTYDKFIVEQYKGVGMDKYKFLTEHDKRFIAFMKSRDDETESFKSPVLFGMQALCKGGADSIIHVTKQVKFYMYYITTLFPVAEMECPELLDEYDRVVLNFVKDSLCSISGIPDKYMGILNVFSAEKVNGNYLIKENLKSQVLRETLLKLIKILEL